MLISLIIFFLSLTGLVAMVGIRAHIDHVRERELFQPVMLRARKVNVFMHNLVHEIRLLISYCNKKTFLLLTHFLIGEVQSQFNRFINFLRSKLPPHK